MKGDACVNTALLGRYILELAMLYPGVFLCLTPLRDHLKNPMRTYHLLTIAVTVFVLAASVVCSILECPSNYVLLPTLIIAFWLLRWRAAPDVSIGQLAFLLSIAAVMLAVCTLLAVIINARAELSNPAPVFLVSTSIVCLSLAAVLSTIFYFTAVQWSIWLLREYRGEAFWESAWPLPALYAVFLMFCMPNDTAIILMNRMQIISVLAVTISLLGVFLLLYEMYKVAQEYTRSAQLNQENQLLAMESRRYMELRAYMDQTRHLRHDFRQHLHVIAGLTEARQQGVAVEWKLELPRLVPMPEADLCTILGNLVENSLHATQKLAPDQRQVRVMARMITPAMMGILVENRYDGVLKKQGGILHSTKHEGRGVGLVSIETAVRKYHGNLTVEPENNIFRVNILLNL